MVTESCPRPIVMFTQDAKRESIREAALARFEAFQSVQTELAQTRSKLSERKLVDRAKGILMTDRKMSEEQAYHAPRKLAMGRSLSMGAVAEQVITVSRVLG
jgi:response regulator NasT